MSLRVMFSREKSDPNYRLTWERCGGGDHRIYRGEPVENDSATDYACGEVVSADGGLTLKPVKCSVSETLAREASEWAYEVRKRREAEQRAKRDAEKAEALAVWDDALAEHAVREAPQRAAWREALLQRPAAQRILRAFPNALPGPDGWVLPCRYLSRIGGFDEPGRVNYEPPHQIVLDPDGEQAACTGFLYGDRATRCSEGRSQLARLGPPDLAEQLAVWSERGPADEDDVIPGKTTLARQVALQVACGVHPFTLEPMPAQKVLYVDLEVGTRYTLEAFKKMAHLPEDSDMLRVEVRPDGLDLSKEEDREWLLTAAEGSDLVVIGPLYKMHNEDLAGDGPAKDVINALDALRALKFGDDEESGGKALWIEAHQPHAANGSGRTLRPYGSSTFLRWPEFGLHLGKDGSLRHWRRPRCEDREWPEAIIRGEEWPWIVRQDDRKPWEKAGMSRASYYRSLNKAQVADDDAA
jgi:hypothetical protein